MGLISDMYSPRREAGLVVGLLLKKHVVIAALVLITLFVYQDLFSFGFAGLDDGSQVPQDATHYQLTMTKFETLFTSHTVRMYQPLTSLVLLTTGMLFGFESASPFHSFSIGLHCINALLVYALTSLLLKHRAQAFFIAALFAIHPLKVESVAWISATSTLMFSFFFLVALWCYCRCIEVGNRRWYWLALLAFTLGGFCKVQIIPFVGVLFLVDHLYERSVLNAKSLFEKLPFVIVALLFVAVALHFRAGRSGFPGFDYDPLLLVPNQFAWYGVKFIWPFDLGVVYDWPQVPMGKWFYLSCCASVLSLWLLYGLRRNRLFVFGLLFYAFNIVLHTSLFSQFLGPYADRYAYLSTLGLCIAGFALLNQRRVKTLCLPLTLVTVFYGVLAHGQVTVWETPVALWSHNITHQTSSFSYGMRGAEYYKRGDYALAKPDFEYVANSPDPRYEPEKFVYLYNALGAMSAESDPKKAVGYFQRAAEAKPSAETFARLGHAHLEVAEFDLAEKVFQEILKRAPNNSAANDGLLRCYLYQEKFSQMGLILNKMIESMPSDALLYKKRAYVQFKLGDPGKAAQDVQRAVALTEESNGSVRDDPELLQLIKMLDGNER